jgi:hypothetical protein
MMRVFEKWVGCIAFSALLMSCGADEGACKNKLAEAHVKCDNDRVPLKEQIAELKGQVAMLQMQLKQAQETPVPPPPDMKPAVHHHEGNLSPEAVMKVMKQNAGGFRACYEKALKRKPDLQFIQSVKAKFSIKGSGQATDVAFVPHADKELEACMAAAMEKWKFPEFSGDPVAFEYPISLISK